MFEKLMFDDIYNFLDHNCLINKKHKASDLDSIALLLLMLINLYMFVVFFWIYSKRFYRGWQEGLLCELQKSGRDSNILFFIWSFLNNRHQRIILNVQFSNWQHTIVGVPQGSVWRPLPFLIYINDLPWCLHSDFKWFPYAISHAV